MKAKKIIKFIVLIFGPLIIGTIVGVITQSDTYKTIVKPFLSPPGALFPIAWSILYLAMGISFYIISKEKFDHTVTKVFIAQLIVNYIWPFLFFKLNLYYLSAIWIVLLLYLVITMIDVFYQKQKIAGYIQIPYFLWLLFALYLNIGVALLN